MPQTWVKALNAYCYPVDLRKYGRASQFPGFFKIEIVGERNSTVAFETLYQQTAQENMPRFFEVVYWKLYSQPNRREEATNRIVNFVQNKGIRSEELWNAIRRFLDNPAIPNLKQIRKLLGIKASVLAVPLTLCALADPQKFPMIDNQVAVWVNSNASTHNDKRKNKLSVFKKKYKVIKDDDFPSYLDWVEWCREVAQILTKLTEREWQTRDVEMAVFTAQRNRMMLNALP
jgi:hypothetical protein